MNDLLETMRVWQGTLPLWAWHEARLLRSSTELGHAVPLDRLRVATRNLAAMATQDAMLRLRVGASGRFRLSMRALPATPAPFTLGISPVVVDPALPSLYHKTTDRSRYDEAAAWARARGFADALLCNTLGVITEASIASVLVRLDGRWYTPPLADGLLPGVMRQVLLDAGLVEARSVAVSDLRAAERVCLCNAVRGVWPVEVR